MEPALQKRVQRYGWDKAAIYYENYWHRNLSPAQDKLIEFADIRPGENIIDIACGTGLVSFRAAELTGKNGFVLGTDISDKMVELSNSQALEKNISNIRFERMEAESLKAPEENFDLALCALGLMYVTDPAIALKEMYKILKPGGRAVAAVWGRRNNCGWAEIFEIVDRRVASEVCPMFFYLGNTSVLDSHFSNAGFKNIKSETINTTLTHASDDEACGAAFAGGPVALAYNKFSDPVKEEAHVEYLESIRKYKNDNGYRIPGEFVITIGYK
jgi:ubiquinone/menaquinone biosynthesis C-methylase UbiE